MAETGVAAATVHSMLADGTATLTVAGCDTPRLDAELLLASVLGLSRAGLVLEAHTVLDVDALRRFEDLLARRSAREPVAYILGRREFRQLTLAVDPRVLIPRPETELLVEVGRSLASGAHVADVGTGSGAVALALKDERPDLVVTGIDMRADALAVACANAASVRLDVTFVQADLLDGGEYDAVLANLPYVAVDAPGLAPEITRYEPASALLAGPDGLDVVRRLVTKLGDVPSVRLVALEIGLGQADAVTELLRAAGFTELERLRDLAGLERVIVGRRR